MKHKVVALDAASQWEMIVFLASLREERWAAEARGLSKNLDDPTPARLLAPEELRARLNQLPESPEQ